jgi:hypothetical protein
MPMRDRLPFRPFWPLFRPFAAPEDGGAAPADTTPAAGDAPAAASAAPNPAPDPAPAAAAKWFEAPDLAPDERKWLESKGLTGIEDPAVAAGKLAKFYREAEKMIGDKNVIKGPAQDQSISDWMKANAKTFGVADSVDGYKVDKPADWPKDLPWNDELDAKAQALAFERGVPVDLHKAYIGLVADYMKGSAETIDREIETARSEMMSELQKDWGRQTEAKLTQAKQAVSHFAGEAGLGQEAIESLMTTMKEKVGDAATMKLFAAIGASMGEDRGVAVGKGAALGLTPSEARAQMAGMSQPGGELYEATRAQDRTRIAAANAKVEQLARIVAGG